LEFLFGISREDILLSQAFEDFLIQRGYLSLLRLKQRSHILVTKSLKVFRANPTFLGPTAGLSLNQLGDRRAHEYSRVQVSNSLVTTDLAHSAFFSIRHVHVPPSPITLYLAIEYIVCRSMNQAFQF
jgi:hypothetical protein